MAKRFTDTSKWAKPGFADLSPRMKMVWFYLCDNCDHAGIWDVNIPLMNFQTGWRFTLEEILDELGDRVEFRGGKLFIPDFVEFQYGELNPDNKAHKSVLHRLDKLAPRQPLERPLQGAKDKDKEKDKVKEKDKEPALEFDAVWKIYPRKDGKSEALTRYRRLIRSEADHLHLIEAIARYKADLVRRGTDPKYVKHFASFLGTEDMQAWRDWLNPEAGTVDLPTPPAGSRSESLNPKVAELYRQMEREEGEADAG